LGQLTAVGVRVWVGAAVSVAVGVAVEVAVDVGDGAGLGVSVGEGVTVGPSHPPGPQADASRETATTTSTNLRFIKHPPYQTSNGAAAAPGQMATSHGERVDASLYIARGRNSSGAAILHISKCG
jgi:hypothetical protein